MCAAQAYNGPSGIAVTLPVACTRTRRVVVSASLLSTLARMVFLTAGFMWHAAGSMLNACVENAMSLAVATTAVPDVARETSRSTVCPGWPIADPRARWTTRGVGAGVHVGPSVAVAVRVAVGVGSKSAEIAAAGVADFNSSVAAATRQAVREQGRWTGAGTGLVAAGRGLREACVVGATTMSRRPSTVATALRFQAAGRLRSPYWRQTSLRRFAS